MSSTPAATKRFAEGTTTPIAKSKSEIETLLKKHGATAFLAGEQGDRAAIIFEMKGRRYRLDLRYPPASDFARKRINQHSYARRSASEMAAAAAGEQQRLWRGLVLLVKGKLEAVASGITTLEEELEPYTIMPNGQRVHDWLTPQLEEAYRTGEMPPLIPGLVSPPYRQIEERTHEQ